MSANDGKKRVALALGACAFAGTLLYFVVGGIGNNLVYYWGPTEVLAAGPRAQGASIRLGDSAGSLYAKLVQIRANGSYDRKFERLLLLTKNMLTSFDPEMAKSPQWYFSQTTAPGFWETVEIHFTDGKLSYILVRRYKS